MEFKRGQTNSNPHEQAVLSGLLDIHHILIQHLHNTNLYRDQYKDIDLMINDTNL